MTRECEGGKGERFLHVTVECVTRGSGGVLCATRPVILISWWAVTLLPQ